MSAGAAPILEPVAPHPILDAATPLAAAPAAPDAVPVAAPRPVEPVDQPTWPCPTCEAKVPFDLASCPGCGSAFLGGATGDLSLSLPVVGDVAKLSPRGRYGLMAAGAAAITLTLFLVYLILGHLV